MIIIESLITCLRSPKGVFPHLWPPGFFFKNRALSLLYPYGALTSCKKLEKSLERSLRYSKTDGPTDQRTNKVDYHGPHRVNPGSKIRKILRAVSEIFKDGPTDGRTDHGQTNGQGRLLRTPRVNPGSKMAFDQTEIDLSIIMIGSQLSLEMTLIVIM